jgi:hypothetical protein
MKYKDEKSRIYIYIIIYYILISEPHRHFCMNTNVAYILIFEYLEYYIDIEVNCKKCTLLIAFRFSVVRYAKFVAVLIH